MGTDYLFNCTTNQVGGGVQNALNFCRHVESDLSSRWVLAVSEAVGEQLGQAAQTNHPICVFEQSPARSRKARKDLERLVSTVSPRAVYTMAGPAYIRIDPVHLMGISNPYITHAQADAFRAGRTIAKAASAFTATVYRSAWARRADYWVFQTGSSRDGFVRRLRVPKEKTFIVPNALGDSFRDLSECRKHLGSSIGDEDRRRRTVFCPSAAHPHKGLELIPRVAERLSANGGANVTFQVTLPPRSAIWRRLQEEWVRTATGGATLVNLGPFEYDQGPSLYLVTDCVFVPSILEVFSASYLEAMATSRPLVVADKPFSREVCGSGAYYFRAGDPNGAAGALMRALRESKEQATLRSAKQHVALQPYLDYSSRFERVRTVLASVAPD